MLRVHHEETSIVLLELHHLELQYLPRIGETLSLNTWASDIYRVVGIHHCLETKDVTLYVANAE